VFRPTGKLSKIKVAKADEVDNVCLAWEGLNEIKGDRSRCRNLRVLVIATRHIMPFDGSSVHLQELVLYSDMGKRGDARAWLNFCSKCDI
jgi:hypothetical protein